MKLLKFIKSLFKKKQKGSILEYSSKVLLPNEIPNGYGLLWDENEHTFVPEKLPFIDPFEHKPDNDTPLYNPLRD